MKLGFIICSRTTSERLPNKVFRKINGIPLIEHLIKRLQKIEASIIIAVPNEEAHLYWHLTNFKNVKVYSDNYTNDPLKRMAGAAKENNLDTVIRVTHDKIFVCEKDLKRAISHFNVNELDYLYSSTLIPGTGFEIISNTVLQDAASRFSEVEFIGFAVKQVAKNICNLPFNDRNRDQIRLLIDFPEDLKLMELIFSKLGLSCTKKEVIEYLNKNDQFLALNDNPLISVYTCAHNAESWIKQCMESIKMQTEFKKLEYILIDDFSNDSTFEEMVNFSLDKKNVKCFRNEKNIGLASSSNKALKEARGKYIIRLDADDYFTRNDALKLLVKQIQLQETDVIYPDNYFGHVKVIQKGNEVHHVGGALFNRDAINHLKFTEGLRAHDSLDIFLKAQKFLKLGYIDNALFFYRQHDKSLSKNKLSERAKIKNQLIAENNRREFQSHRN